nr:hypothetical protein [Kibdelosporangium sp. MJ126-NF4]CEL18549.1 Phage protein [Kibdelosporangium sp. MJ126-NF4]CTQ98033.1 Phage protein [Kibdelosporangium sp. MJ126-NF4]
MPIIERRGYGIGYADEIAADRDTHGVLWHRTLSRPGEGRPEFGKVHSLRQRRAMRRLLCQVCAEPADRTDDGMLWLLPDYRQDWTRWPEGMGNVEPPVCWSCVSISIRLCPKLRRDGGAVIRVREYPLVGVRGLLYASGTTKPIAVADRTIGFDDPLVRWVRAVGLVRQMLDCRIVAFEELVEPPGQQLVVAPHLIETN